MLSLKLILVLVLYITTTQAYNPNAISEKTISVAEAATLANRNVLFEGETWTLSRIALQIKTTQSHRPFTNRYHQDGRKIFNGFYGLIAIDLPTQLGSYWAILTSDKHSLLGIVSRNYQRNQSKAPRLHPIFTLVYNVEKEKKSGAYLNHGLLPDPVPLLRDSTISQLIGRYGNRHPFIAVIYNHARTEIHSLVGYARIRHVRDSSKHTILYQPPRYGLPRRPHAERRCQPMPLGYIVTFQPGTSEFAMESHYRMVATLSPETPIQQRYQIGNFRGYAAFFDEKTANIIQRMKIIALVEKESLQGDQQRNPHQGAHNTQQHLYSTSTNTTTPLLDTQIPSSNTSARLHAPSWATMMLNSPWQPSDQPPPRKRARLMPPSPASREGKGTWAYVVDSGISILHQEFENRLRQGLCIAADCQEDVDFFGYWFDATGHGTQVASIIGGAKNGVAKKTTLIDVRVVNACDGSHCFFKTFAQCRNYGFSAIREHIYREIHAAGILVVVSAGNQALPAAWDTPRGKPTVLTVGAVDSDWQEAPFSNYGPAVDVLGPGVNVPCADWNTLDGDMVVSGTSMAAPFAAGLALKLLSDEDFHSPTEKFTAPAAAFTMAGLLLVYVRMAIHTAKNQRNGVGRRKGGGVDESAGD
ncbi:hypothetical protein CDD80_715 [Ophiocordyceps camponoti-rufipedis]|uniref:Peptidase S8/S53 domain-containing protein n=1 Tax=Ophiocordyceps camponoti-rufipedis TaxID=2004952 RepID=A0A2C5ZD41_9HYPO|nr:hypothetical protein CDD80_715 [Ophiocordyceps camponoti-rufipedis]